MEIPQISISSASSSSSSSLPVDILSDTEILKLSTFDGLTALASDKPIAIIQKWVNILNESDITSMKEIYGFDTTTFNELSGVSGLLKSTLIKWRERLDRHVSVFQKHTWKDSTRAGLRFSQREALDKARLALEEKKSDRFMIAMPTGSGKTHVMALLPFWLKSNRTLIVQPGVVLKKQINLQLEEFFEKYEKHMIPELQSKIIKISKELNSQGKKPDFWITNVQELRDCKASKKNNNNADKKEEVSEIKEPTTPGGGSPTKGGGGAVKLRDEAIDLLQEFQPDLFIADEGHHWAAASWKAIADIPNLIHSKKVLLTATPQRGDGRTYGLSHEWQYYLYSRQNAIKDHTIKQTKFFPIQVPNRNRKNNLSDFYCSREYLEPLFIKAAEDVKQKRSYRDFPHRILALANTKKQCTAMAALWNEISHENNWNLYAKAIFSGQKDYPKRKKGFEEIDAYKQKKEKDSNFIVDIAFQCNLFGEGYNNKCISISLILTPPGHLGKLTQVHGRALRIIDTENKNKDNSPENIASLIYPQSEWMDGLVEQYKRGEDEKAEYILDPNPEPTEMWELQDYHKIMKLFASPSHIMRDRFTKYFNSYHDCYEQTRENWNVIPAELIATDLLLENKDILAIRPIFRILDCGSGRDHLFAKKLAQSLYMNSSDPKLEIYELDLGDSGSDWQNDNPKVFRIPCDYCNLDEVRDTLQAVRASLSTTTITTELNTSTSLSLPKFDAAIFSLSLWSTNFYDGLEVAFNLLESRAPIYIIEMATSFGMLPGANPNKLSARVKEFRKKLETIGFLEVTVEKKDMFIYFRCLCPKSDAKLNQEILKELPKIMRRNVAKPKTKPIRPRGGKPVRVKIPKNKKDKKMKDEGDDHNNEEGEMEEKKKKRKKKNNKQQKLEHEKENDVKMQQEEEEEEEEEEDNEKNSNEKKRKKITKVKLTAKKRKKIAKAEANKKNENKRTKRK